MHLSFHVPQASSLKDKRRIIKSFKDRTRNRFNVSIAEVEGLDTHRRAVVAITTVSNDQSVCDSTLQKIARQGALHRDLVLIEQQIDWI
jgi:hypothetical protein